MKEMDRLDAVWDGLVALLPAWPLELYQVLAQEVADIAELRALEHWHQRRPDEES
jgi:hypothetical protein